MDSKAFTLIELLVVIAIIAMLMGIMMPVLIAVKEQARSTVCQTNLAQYGIADIIYLEDYNSCFVPIWSWLYDPGSGQPNYQPVGCQWHNALLKRDGLLWPNRRR
jgi:prepilin-type N-terminal cleavage/methylation domain-containing protein